MNTPSIAPSDRVRINTHYGLVKVPFRKNMTATEMFDSRAQRELIMGLRCWLDVRGLAAIVGEPGVGKSISLRRFVQEVDPARHQVRLLAAMPTSAHGFLRHLNSALGQPMRSHTTDLFEQAQAALATAEGDPHVVLVIDDCEGLKPECLDIVRRLTARSLDADDHFSVVLSGTEAFAHTLRATPSLEPLRSRFSFATTLGGFSLEDTRNYLRFHVARAGGPNGLFSDDAEKRVFHLSRGKPRIVNQIAIACLIAGAVGGTERISAATVDAVLRANPLYDVPRE